jgi:serine/threonine-protein kinase
MQGRPTNQTGKAGRTAPAGSRTTGGADSPRLRPGSSLGRYELVVRLFRGDTTEVWLSKGPGEKGTAIKALRVDIPHSPEVIGGFVREATIAAKLHHPNIVQLTDCGKAGARHYMAMEHVDGMSLAQVRERLGPQGGRLPLGLLASLLQQISMALHYAHETSDEKGWLGFLHRDVSPANILVSGSGAAKLIDFGAARMRSVPDAVVPQTVRNRYAAPERVQGLSEDRRSDVYSVGVILYELATGWPPFHGTELEVISQIVEGHARDPRELVPDLPEPMARIILRAMAPKLTDRYPNSQALATELESFIHDHPVGDDVEAVMRRLFDAPADRAPERVPTPVPVPEETIKVIIEEPEPVVAPAPAAAGGAPTPGVAPRSRERFAPDADFSNDDITRPTAMVLPDRVVDVTPDLVVEAVAVAAPKPEPAPAWVSERQEALSKPQVDIFAGPRRHGGSGSFAFGADGQPERRDAFPARRATPSAAPPADVFSLYGRGERAAPPPEPPMVTERPLPDRRPAHPAAQRFDRGLELLAAKLHEPALAEWEEACRLDPGNRVYQTNLKRLRAQIAARANRQTTESE